MRRTICKVALCLVFGLMFGCVQTGQYTSKDLTILPCEQKANEFFFPLEFDEVGNQVYADQATAIETALHSAQRVYVFVHGWNKNPKLAEGDYQDLICRFHTHSKRGEASVNRSIIIGVFWPSADFPPLFNFWRMKSRADDLALTGFQSLIKLLANPAIESGGHYDLVLIGHSFGGRIILEGMTHYIAQLTPERHRFLSSLNQLQLILLTTAMGEYILTPLPGLTEDLLAFGREWDAEAFLQEMTKQYGHGFTHKEVLVDVLELRLQWHPSLVQISGLTDFRIYNIFSTHDDANRFLYPIGSFMERGGPTCAIGACGVYQWPNLASVTSAGNLETVLDLAESNLWNVDASKVVFSHTDIYKGRIANLAWELIALPRPQYAEIVVPEHTMSSRHYYLGDRDFYEEMAHDNRRAMKKINQFRQLGEAGLKSVQELSSLAFNVDEELRKENWAAAEMGIREIAKLEDIYPGWSFHFGVGLVRKGLLWDSSSMRAEWRALTKDTIQLLLSWVLIKQGRCGEVAQVRNEAISSLRALQVEVELFLKALESYKFRLLNCHE